MQLHGAGAVTAFGRPARGVRLAWKMSIDLQRAEVPSSGQHEVLDGLVTCLQLQARRSRDVDAPDLSGVIGQLEAMAAAGDWRTDDPLGLGGLLADASRLMQLPGEQRPGANARASDGPARARRGYR